MSGLARQLRLRRSTDFRLVQRSGERTTTPNLVVCYRPNGLVHPRFGLTVSRKVGNAVVRNRVKRWLREGIRQHRGSFETTPSEGQLTGVDIVFIARSSAATAGAEVLCAEVADALGVVRARGWSR